MKGRVGSLMTCTLILVTVKSYPGQKVFNFTQDDLDEDDMMMLDTWSQLFIWVGENANKEEKEQSAVIAYEYLIKHPSGNTWETWSKNVTHRFPFRLGRDPKTNIIIIKQGREPPIFTGWFGSWDPHMWANGKSYDEIRAEMGEDDLFKAIELSKISKSTPEVVEGR